MGYTIWNSHTLCAWFRTSFPFGVAREASTFLLTDLFVGCQLCWKDHLVFICNAVCSDIQMYVCVYWCMYWFPLNPNTIKSYKISQKLSPKHAARGVAQWPYPICRHGKACLSKQPPWRAAGDPRLARSRSRVRSPAPVGTLLMLFFSTFPSFLLQEIVFFRTFPTNPWKC